MAKWLLMASFVQKDSLYEALDQISRTINISKNSIFVFKNEDDEDEYVLTYNLNPEQANIQFSSIWQNTVSIHRKKHTNTLYSLNAMNELIKSKNNGILDKTYQINWGDYENTLLMIKRGQLRVIPIKLIKINQ